MPDSANRQPTVRPLGADDLAQAHSLSIEAGWSHRIEDWKFVRSLGVGYGAYCGPTSLVGTALWWPFGDRMATAGMVIVARAARGRGIGRQLLRAIMDDAGTRTIMLNSTREGRRLYESVGFCPSTTVRQHQGMVRRPDVARAAPADRLRRVNESDIGHLNALDHAATGIPRGMVLHSLFQQGDGIALDRGGAAVGFSFMRRFGRGSVIGPVVAPDGDAAVALVSDCLRRCAGEFVRIDTPSQDDAFASMLVSAGLEQVDEVTTMWRGAAPDAGRHMQVFGLINQALG